MGGKRAKRQNEVDIGGQIGQNVGNNPKIMGETDVNSKKMTISGCKRGVEAKYQHCGGSKWQKEGGKGQKKGGKGQKTDRDLVGN